jgi:hypothetical protein
MAGWGSLLRRKVAKPEPEIIGRIKSCVRHVLALPAGTTLTVNEIACLDPACPGLETVILVMEPGRKTRAYKIARALDAVTDQDVRDAVA